MPNILSKRDIVVPKRPLSGITQKNIKEYLLWSVLKKGINSRILKTFKESSFRETGYSDENRPKEKVSTEIQISREFRIEVETTPTKKKPPYSLINTKFLEYVEFLNERYETKKRPTGVLTIDNQTFIDSADLDTKLTKIFEQESKGRGGISQKLTMKKYPPIRLSNNFIIEFERDYSALTDYNARAYIIAERLYSLGAERIGIIGSELKADALKTLGKEPDKVETISYPFENISYIVQLEPRTSILHANVFNAFTKGAPNVLKSNSKIGDFKKIDLINKGYKGQLLEKGLIDEEFINDYSPKLRNGKMYVRTAGVKKRIFDYRRSKQNTSKPIEMNIFSVQI